MKCRRHCCILFFVLVFGLLCIYVSVRLHCVRWGLVSLVLVLPTFSVVLDLYCFSYVLCDTFYSCFSFFLLFYSYMIFKSGYRSVVGDTRDVTIGIGVSRRRPPTLDVCGGCSCFPSGLGFLAGSGAWLVRWLFLSWSGASRILSSRLFPIWR